MKLRLFLFFVFICNTLFSQTAYWNENTHLIPWRIPLVSDKSSVIYEDLNGDGKPDIIRTTILDGIPVIWIDDVGFTISIKIFINN